MPPSSSDIPCYSNRAAHVSTKSFEKGIMRESNRELKPVKKNSSNWGLAMQQFERIQCIFAVMLTLCMLQTTTCLFSWSIQYFAVMIRITVI